MAECSRRKEVRQTDRQIERLVQGHKSVRRHVSCYVPLYEPMGVLEWLVCIALGGLWRGCAVQRICCVEDTMHVWCKHCKVPAVHVWCILSVYGALFACVVDSVLV